MKKRYRIENLDCANCAAKVERGLAAVEGVKSVSVQFVQMRLVLEADDADFDSVFAAVTKRAKELEPEIGFYAEEPVRHSVKQGLEPEQKSALFRIIAAVVLLVIAWLLPVQGLWRLPLFAVPYLIAGYPVLANAARNLLHGQFFDESLLMTLATFGAFAIGEYPEAAFVMIFFQTGELFEDIAVGRSRRSISALMDIRPDRAAVLRNGEELSVSPEEVAVGETVTVRPGERIPLDGVILSGKTTVQTAALTGESVPRSAAEGDAVMSGTINQSGLITVRVTSSYAEGTVSKILELVENAAEKKSKAERFITRFSRVYTPAVVICAVLLAVIPPLCFHQPWADWLRRACVFLMVSCPCALVVSVPLSFFGGIGGASRCGILVKGANDLERLAEVDTVVFDKTGTLTHGEFEVEAIHPQECTADALLDIAAAAEQRSTHPVGESIIRAHSGHLDPSRLSAVEEIAGMGLHAVIDGKDYDIGNTRLMERCGVQPDDCPHDGTVIHIAEGKTYLGHIAINDKIKADAKKTIQNLKALGIARTVMLTGDVQQMADAVGAAVGVDAVRAQLLPADKVTAVEELEAQGCRTAFAGDGINDAPVLMRADVGIAMGAMGSDAAMEAADIVLMDDRIGKLCTAIATARKTMRIVRQNIWFAIGVKLLILVLGACGAVSLWLAVFGDVGVLMLAVLNALRAMRPAMAEQQKHEHTHTHHHDGDDDDDDDCDCGHEHHHGDDDGCGCGHAHHHDDDDDDDDDCDCGHEHHHHAS